jgi:hypothetical protein
MFNVTVIKKNLPTSVGNFVLLYQDSDLHLSERLDGCDLEQYRYVK